ncbi:hypothetical protein NBT05_02665 [Aquimarina sp. ERC-38]|uniref:hypothetical protein n=1 Tax=Aquimarina sp. ERC-38 TaxID=2949996 RepID=UPI002245699A|nr:hypothetical protein [Aquimarina sp. ERC-38]UZO81384.1 hypothetical protein NBT05_02665 [Aquimarina sp. ERC-38]
MKINLNKLYIVYNPGIQSGKADVFNGKPTDITGLRYQFYRGLVADQVYGIYTTKASAQKAADRLRKTSPHTPLEGNKPSKDKKERFREFIAGLEELSSKHGIAIQSIGGVLIFEYPIPIIYDEDHTSGDLIPNWEED